MVVPMRIERMTPALSARCSNHLSYGTILKQDTIDLRRSTIELIPLYQGVLPPLNSSPIATLPGELWQGMKGIEPTLPAWQAIKLLLMSLIYINIIT